MLDIMHRNRRIETADKYVEAHQRHHVSSENRVGRGGRRKARCRCVAAQLSTATQFVRAAGHDHRRRDVLHDGAVECHGRGCLGAGNTLMQRSRGGAASIFPVGMILTATIDVNRRQLNQLIFGGQMPCIAAGIHKFPERA